ncbi:AMP-binding protein [Cellvibrio japonicus]|uniref:Long-chain-fatty-acid--CoA ligase n=1 Tax=Cellvibrio japonicus (strain Ueda107) TaxID=498211 RepID=B3PBA3_CELJU|nr:AMP-binding protein [Cellvibrio japonicus]ACE85982.1 long-chain-fatty-acid--CoA ligase [Cellvibrio japonicus Ueda107]QEI11688.1 AMP-binding protein [Cellvibrio japonicus]QEI15262.1 AMP-binding protein [Cellvibrio japonicus]QEI18842.1 AMP-binding protein [Cellvibrio japonicus]
MPLNYNRTIADVFAESCREFASAPAFTCMGRTLSYADLDRLSGAFAAYLQQHTSLKPGDRVAVQLPNILQYPVAVFGILRAGMVVVNTNPLYTAHEIKHQLNDSGAKALVVLANIAKNAAAVIAETNVEQVIVTELADLHTPFKRVLLNFAVKYVKKMVPPFQFPHQVPFNEALAKASVSFTPVTRDHEDIAVLQYTGGTTGVAKGAMLSNRNLVANMLQVNDHMKTVFRPQQEFYVAPLPLYHIYSFTIHCTSAMALGNHSLLIPNPRDIPGFVKALKQVPFTFFVGLNTLFNALLRNPDFQKLDFSHLRLSSSGGMALTTETAHHWVELTKAPLTEGYGLTETSPVLCINPVDNVQLGTVGIPVMDTECKVIDEHGNSLPTGEAGELCVRGPQVMKGYWQRPDATAEVLDADGWFKTGDIAIIQADGFVKIVDRKKDMINVSGFKVFPNEVEDVLCSHPDIIEAAVVGIPDGDGSEQVKAFIVTSNPELSLEQVRKYAKEQLTPYKVPHLVEFRKELPKTNVGKILRRELRDQEVAAKKA